jgi:enoyl-CoA hydratase/carnithine racemase
LNRIDPRFSPVRYRPNDEEKMMVKSGTEELLVDFKDGGVVVVTLNRPKVRNAINATLTIEIESVIKQIEADDSVRVAILASSHEKVFCAGADLAEISAGRGHMLATPEGGLAGFVRARRAKPWIAAVRGAAFGGGFELALACDMIVASGDAQFALPEVKRGIYAAAGGAYRLAKRLPRSIALELLATGGVLEASRAFAFGLVNRLAPAGQVLESAVDLARAIAENAPLAVCETLSIARLASEMPETELHILSERVREYVYASEDAREGTRAFLEKRPPVWCGR